MELLVLEERVRNIANKQDLASPRPEQEDSAVSINKEVFEAGESVDFVPVLWAYGQYFFYGNVDPEIGRFVPQFRLTSDRLLLGFASNHYVQSMNISSARKSLLEAFRQLKLIPRSVSIGDYNSEMRLDNRDSFLYHAQSKLLVLLDHQGRLPSVSANQMPIDARYHGVENAAETQLSRIERELKSPVFLFSHENEELARKAMLYFGLISDYGHVNRKLATIRGNFGRKGSPESMCQADAYSRVLSGIVQECQAQGLNILKSR